MNREECASLFGSVPDYVVAIFWVVLAVIMLAIMFIAVCACLNCFLEYYYSRRWDYLRNKELKAQVELSLLKTQKEKLEATKNEHIEDN